MATPPLHLPNHINHEAADDFRSKSAPISSTSPVSGPSMPFSHSGIGSPARDGQKVDMLERLERLGPSVVNTRNGSVLSRGSILKTDHYPSGRALDLELNVHGAPNFRSPKQGHLNVYGAAQPRTQGLRAILSILKCHPNSPDPSHCVWFSTREEPIVYISGRSFVLRDGSEPRKTLALSDRAENLEGIERRLKNDILQESLKYGGLVLTHNEVVTEHGGDGAILPTWTAVDTANVKTSRELWENMKKDGWRVDYHRIPISPDRPIEDNYLDAYVRVIKETNPLQTSLVFSCGMGAVRTTFAMVAAQLVRRAQLLSQGLEDPFLSKGLTPKLPRSSEVALALEQANAQQELNKSFLKLINILQKSFPNRTMNTAVDILMAHPALTDNLRKAHMGNYGVILSLLGCIDNGLKVKRLVDKVIDASDHVVNLREEILINRIRYSLTTLDDKKRQAILDKAAKSIEKYFFMIAFASYVEGQTTFDETFSQWMKTRTEIWNQVHFLRKSHGSRLNVFAPIADLSAISKVILDNRQISSEVNQDLAITGGKILGDEYSDYVVKNRKGIVLRQNTFLKSDLWLAESHDVAQSVRGAINFRNIPGTAIYALGQPTMDATNEVVRRVKMHNHSADHIAWITLREEPIVYINGVPYCLRRDSFTLRNMKDYGGISESRLQVLEERLKDDVVAEIREFGGRLLVHRETSDGSILPVWEEVQEREVEVIKEIMERQEHQEDNDLSFHYRRIPLTAESPPDFSDISDLMDIVIRTHTSHTPIILNCQLGRGRSTVTSIIVLLIEQWLQADHGGQMTSVPPSPSTTFCSAHPIDNVGDRAKRHSYQVINNLLRVMRNGVAIKAAVDEAIDRCGELLNILESIEDARTQAEQATNEQKKKEFAQKGLQNLRRYFTLIIFQWYLQSTKPDTMRSFESFETFVKKRPVLRTLEKELFAEGLHALKPLERVDLADSVALPDEVKQVVASRNGSILSAFTILKSDFFVNLQKMSLPERIEGAPNFRQIHLVLDSNNFGPSSAFTHMYETKLVCGSGMPTVQGLRRVLSRVHADSNGRSTVVWTSLREEPVLYILGRPHVFRLSDRPLENVEATGITTQVVENMEKSLKRDVLQELRSSGGRLLLHDEVEERPGVYSIIPVWENLEEQDIMTPRDVFELMTKEGFRLDYDRVAITDEQAPLPDAIWQLYKRITTALQLEGQVNFIFNCQMGRGRTTTGMVTACLIATISYMNVDAEYLVFDDTAIDAMNRPFDSLDGPSEDDAYLQGEYKVILQVVGVLSHGRIAKKLTDRAIDAMQDVQNLRKAVYDCKLKLEACDKNSLKYDKLFSVTVNYLYRYGALIVFANYLIEVREYQLHQKKDVELVGLEGFKLSQQPDGSILPFPEWLREHREITTLLSRRTLE